jgi:two-component system, NarL family, sensor histidine kinase UhpB
VIRRLLRIPLFLKLVVGNGILLAAAAGTGVALGRADPGTVGVGGSLVILLMILLGMIGVNGLLVKLALGPLEHLSQAADRVAKGELGVRVRPPAQADGALRRLFRTFDRMLLSMERSRETRDGLARDLLEAGEHDRRLLSGEILGGSAQSLSTALLLLGGSRAGEADRDPAASAVREALEDLRRISALLHPPELADLGLATALRALMRSALEAKGVPCRVEVGGDGAGLREELSVGAFRIVQEGVALAGRIPELNAAALRLRRTRSVLLIRLELSGVPSSFLVGAGTGWREVGMRAILRRMTERARLLGGTLGIATDQRSCLAVRIRLPLEGPRPGAESPTQLPIAVRVDAYPVGTPQPPRASRIAQ